MGYSYKEWSRMIEAKQVIHYLEIHEIRRQQRQRPRPAPPSRDNQLRTIRMLLHMSTRLALFEAGAALSRLYAHVKSQRPFAMFSAELPELTYDENEVRTMELVMELKAAGLGGIQVVGYWRKTPQARLRPETAFFVPYLGTDLASFRQTILDLIRQCQQHEALFSDGRVIGDLERSGRFTEKYSEVSVDPRLITDAWSEIRKRTFVFVESGTAGSNGEYQAFDCVGLLPDLAPEVSRQQIGDARARGAFVRSRSDRLRHANT